LPGSTKSNIKRAACNLCKTQLPYSFIHAKKLNNKFPLFKVGLQSEKEGYDRNKSSNGRGIY
jgi:hypothetical protein